MPSQDYPPAFLTRLQAVTAKRPRAVIDHILQHGHITTEELKEQYGYNHPPRAARDVREQGIPLKTVRVTGTDGRSIAAYEFGDPMTVQRGQLEGRRVFSKDFKRLLVQRDGERCNVCSDKYPERYLQVDHRVPYEVSGDEADGDRDLTAYMLVCGSCNRAKSWSCEHCSNWQVEQLPEVCRACYWGSPESYTHVALRSVRRLDVVWDGQETVDYDRLKTLSSQAGLSIAAYLKALLHRQMNE